MNKEFMCLLEDLVCWRGQAVVLRGEPHLTTSSLKGKLRIKQDLQRVVMKTKQPQNRRDQVCKAA